MTEQQDGVAQDVSPLRVVEVDAQTDARWQDLVTTLPGGVIYQHPAWLQVLEEAFGYRGVHLACQDATGQLRGILPLCYQRGLLSGRQFSSLPRTPVAGPLACDNEALTVLVGAALERTRAEPGAQLQLKLSSALLDGLVEGVVGVPWRETYLLELPQRPELLRFGNARNHARIKWAINKATKQGLQVHVAETERDLRAWYELYLETMRRITVPPRPYRFFAVAWERLRPRGLLRLLLATVYEAGRARVVAGSLLLLCGQTVCYGFTGWRRQDVLLRPNDVLQWRAMQDACVEGYRYYDFGEVTRHNQGLSEFKSKWGAQSQWLYRYYYPAPREVETGMLDATGRLHQLARAVWQRLPLKATELLSNVAHHYF